MIENKTLIMYSKEPVIIRGTCGCKVLIQNTLNCLPMVLGYILMLLVQFRLPAAKNHELSHYIQFYSYPLVNIS